MGTLIGILIFVGFTIGIWFSYRLFMRGDTAEEKVARYCRQTSSLTFSIGRATPMWVMKKRKTGSCWLIGLTRKCFPQGSPIIGTRARIDARHHTPLGRSKRAGSGFFSIQNLVPISSRETRRVARSASRDLQEIDSVFCANGRPARLSFVFCFRVQQIRRGAAGQRRNRVLRCRHRHRAARRLGRAADVRREHDILELEKPGLSFRLALEYVEPRGAQCRFSALGSRPRRRPHRPASS